MTINQVNALIGEIIGMPLWEISIGPSGFNIDFGKEVASKHYPITRGEISMWVQCNTKIFYKKELKISSTYPQYEEETNIYKEYFKDKLVSDIFIDESDRSLHIKVEPETEFVAYPSMEESEESWAVYDHRIENPPGILVYADSIVIAE